MDVFLIVYVLIYVFILATDVDAWHIYPLIKTILSFTFLFYAYSNAHGKKLSKKRLNTFYFCALGDLFMAFAAVHHSISNYYIFAGMICFFIAYGQLILYFFHLSAVYLTDFIPPLLFSLLIFIFTYLKEMNVGTMRLPMVLYAFIIKLLASKAWDLYKNDKTNMLYQHLLLSCSLLFISDFCLMFVKFLNSTPKILSLLVLTSYYLGMLILAKSIKFMEDRYVIRNNHSQTKNFFTKKD